MSRNPFSEFFDKFQKETHSTPASMTSVNPDGNLEGGDPTGENSNQNITPEQLKMAQELERVKTQLEGFQAAQNKENAPKPEDPADFIDSLDLSIFAGEDGKNLPAVKALFTSLYTQMREKIVQEATQNASTVATSQVTAQQAAYSFFNDPANKDLSNRMVKGIVAQEAQRIAEKSPNMSLDQVLAEAGKNVRTELGLPTSTSDDSGNNSQNFHLQNTPAGGGALGATKNLKEEIMSVVSA